MAIPDRDAVLKMNFADAGVPFVQVGARVDIELTKMNFADRGLPFIGPLGEEAPPPEGGSQPVLLVVMC